MGNFSLFKLLILSVLIPVIGSIAFLGYINLSQYKDLLKSTQKTEHRLVVQEIKNIVDIANDDFSNIERADNQEIIRFSNLLIHQVLPSITSELPKINLDSIKEIIHVDSLRYEVYLINKENIVVNSTFKPDLGLNLNIYGTEVKNRVSRAFNSNETVISYYYRDNFGSHRYLKYAFTKIKNAEYVLLLSVVSDRSSQLIRSLMTKLNQISDSNAHVVSVDFLVGRKGISLDGEEKLDSLEKVAYAKIMTQMNSDKKSIELEDRKISFIPISTLQFPVNDRGVVRIVRDYSDSQNLLTKSKRILWMIMFLVVVVLLVILFFASHSITSSLKLVEDGVNKVLQNNFSARVEIKGSAEVSSLSKRLNLLLNNFQSYYLKNSEKIKALEIDLEKVKSVSDKNFYRKTRVRERLDEANRNLSIAYNRIEIQAVRFAKAVDFARMALVSVRKYKISFDHFIFNKPKEIVGGDFFWMYEIDSKSYIVVGDSPGFGLSGAFMSVAVCDLLNRLSCKEKYLEPHELLEHLSGSLHEKLTDYNFSDGIKLCVGVIDQKQKSVTVSGARIPAFVVSSEKELTTIKTSYNLVGVAGSTFNQTVTNYSEGDKIYIATDGYSDQFGGDYNKKFMVKKLREVLVANSDLPLEQQKEILKSSMSDWMINDKQVDDMLIVGIQL